MGNLPWPIDSQTIVTASDTQAALSTQPATILSPAQPMDRASWVHKTGSTKGFGAYIAFVPQQNSGVILLANKNYPNPERIKAAVAIMAMLASD